MKTFEHIIFKGDVPLLKRAFDEYRHGVDLPFRDHETLKDEVIVDFSMALGENLKDFEDFCNAMERYGRLQAEEDKRSRGGDGHASDCATHNEPATPNGPCDCRPDKNEALRVAADPLIKHLCDNWNPHTKVIVTNTSAEILSGEVSVQNIYEHLKD